MSRYVFRFIGGKYEGGELALLPQGEMIIGRAQEAEIEAEKIRVAALKARDLDEAVGKLSQEAKDLAATRAPIAAKLPADLLKLYEKHRASTGLGAAALKAGRCSGCQLQVTVADLDAYRRAPAEQVLRCAECDRILVRTAESGL